MIGNREWKEDRQSPMLLALVFVALVPAVCVFWFMTVAMRNERLAVQQELTGVYLNHLGSVQRQLTAFWKEKQSTLLSLTNRSPSESFASMIHSNLADSVILYDSSGNLLYPASATTNLASQIEDQSSWVAARELEFQKTNYIAAAEAYAQLARSVADVHLRVRAFQAQASCLIKAGQKTQAIQVLTGISSGPDFQNAVGSQGTLAIPNVQLLLLKLIQDPSSELHREIRARLAERLNDYTQPRLSSSQRRFLMEELQAMSTGESLFPTLSAEQMAAHYVERSSTRPSAGVLQPAALPGIWCLATPDRTVIALFRERRLLEEMQSAIQGTLLPDISIRLLRPQARSTGTGLVPLQEAGELMPGWRLSLAFKGVDPFEAAFTRRTRFYLWIGSLVILVTGLLALLVARFVAAQTRLTRLKNDLVSNVSHELKTPLASMRVLVDTLLAKRYRGPEQLENYLQLVAKENQRLSHLIENFLSFSRMERNKQKFQMEEVKVGAIVHDALDAMQDRLASPNCRLAVELADDLPSVYGDREALTSVVINLLDNACKYSGADKQIVVRAYRTNGAVSLEVQDKGIGLSRRETKRIFERFYQVDQSLSRKASGCGLGLSIVHFIVKSHHGSVTVESELGQGSTFTVRLPVGESVGGRGVVG